MATYKKQQTDNGAAQSFVQEQWKANTEAEQKVLSCLLYNPNTIKKVVDILKPDHFSRDAHQSIYRAMVTLYTKERRVSIDNLTDELDRVGKIEEIGRDYLYKLADALDALGDVDDAARIVIRKHTMRQLIYAAQDITRIALEENDDALEQVEKIVYDIATGARSSHVLSFDDALDTYMTDLDRRREEATQGIARGLPTGYPDVDRLMGGMQPGNLIALGALTGFGKSAFALNVALSIIMNQKHVLFASLEMTSDEIIQRALSIEAEVDQSLLRDGTLNDATYRSVKATRERMRGRKLDIDDTSFSIGEICATARRVHARQPLDLFVVDYLQLIESIETNGKSSSTRTEEIASISRRLKRLAQELNIPVMALVQLNRAVEHRQEHDPKLADINESGSIARDSNVVMFIYATKEEVEKRDRSEAHSVFVKVAKNRSGRMGEVSLGFVPRATKFINAEKLFAHKDEV